MLLLDRESSPWPCAQGGEKRRGYLPGEVSTRAQANQRPLGVRETTRCALAQAGWSGRRGGPRSAGSARGPRVGVPERDNAGLGGRGGTRQTILPRFGHANTNRTLFLHCAPDPCHAAPRETPLLRSGDGEKAEHWPGVGSARSQGAWFRGAGGVHPPPTAGHSEERRGGGAPGLRAVRSGAPLRVRSLRPGTQPGDRPGAQSCRPPRGAPCHAHRPRAPAPRAPLQGGEWAEPRCPSERPPATGPASRSPPSAAARSPPPLGSRGSHTPARGVMAPAIPGCTSVSSRRRSRAGNLPISSVPSHHQAPGPFWRVLKEATNNLFKSNMESISEKALCSSLATSASAKRRDWNERECWSRSLLACTY
nr:translation initiation factor IF-2-like [Manis javanica]